MKKLRDWLNLNKVFFETVISLIISVITINIAIVANNIQSAQQEIARHQEEIARDQEQIARDQEEISRQSAAPLIDVATEYDENGNVIKVEVINSGGLLDEIDVDFYPYILYQLFINNTDFQDNDHGVAYGIYPCVIKQDTSNSNSNKNTRILDHELNPYRQLTPHTKIGSVYEIINTEFMSYIEMMMDDTDGYSRSITGDEYIFGLKDDDRYVISCYYLSFEYMIKIKYTSTVSQNPKTEVFRVVTGIGFDHNYIAKITPGVSKVEDKTKFPEGYNLLSLYSAVTDSFQADNLRLKGLSDSVKTDSKLLIETLVQKFLEGQYLVYQKDNL